MYNSFLNSMHNPRLKLEDIVHSEYTDYSKLSLGGLRALFSVLYCELAGFSEGGNMAPICVKADLDEALGMLTKREAISIRNGLIKGNNRVDKWVIDTSLTKVLYYLKTGKVLENTVALEISRIYTERSERNERLFIEFGEYVEENYINKKKEHLA